MAQKSISLIEVVIHGHYTASSSEGRARGVNSPIQIYVLILQINLMALIRLVRFLSEL